MNFYLVLIHGKEIQFINYQAKFKRINCFLTNRFQYLNNLKFFSFKHFKKNKVRGFLGFKFFNIKYGHIYRMIKMNLRI